MGKHENRTLPTSRPNDVFSEGLGLEHLDMKEIEKEREREAKKKPTRRDKIREELEGAWIRYLNSKDGERTFFDEIIDYIEKKKIS